jgi:pimeloyl-ACP methyl ester carboxylesterase
MNSSMSACPGIHFFPRSIFLRVAVVFFLFGCSKNPVFIDGQQTEPIAVSTAPIHQFIVPSTGWNGDLMVYAHGFVPPIAPVTLPAEAAKFATIASSEGYAFATTSYPSNGMVVTEGLTDLVNLVAEFRNNYPETGRVFLLGVSMGGLIAAQAAEKYPGTFDGVLAICGIYGSYPVEIVYITNFRTVFDYFFPDLLPGDAVNVAFQTMLEWNTVYIPKVVAACSAPENGNKVRQLIAVTKLPANMADPASVVQSIVEVLSLGIYVTEDVKSQLGGQPFGNHLLWYHGSDDDCALNAGIKRYQADPNALAASIRLFGTTGNIKMPVVTLHNRGDNLAPVIQQALYGIKVMLAGKSSRYKAITLNAYGHSNFSPEQIQSAFQMLVAKTMTP